MRYGFKMARQMHGLPYKEHLVDMSDSQINSFINKAVKEIDRKYADCYSEPKYLSVSTIMYEALILNSNNDGQIEYVERFLGIPIIVNPYQEADVIPLLDPREEYLRSW